MRGRPPALTLDLPNYGCIFSRGMSGAMKSGPLQVQEPIMSFKLSHWRTRWVCLDGQTLSIYKTSTAPASSAAPAGTHQLRLGCQVNRDGLRSVRLVDSSGQELVVRAADDGACEAWMSAFQAAQNQCEPTSEREIQCSVVTQQRSVRDWGISMLEHAFDRVGLAEPAAPMLDWLSGGAVAAVPGAERFAAAQCPICFDGMPSFAASGCEHALCTPCAVAYVRGALGDVQAQIFAAGVRCPLHPSGCEGFISSTDAARLLTARDAKRLDSDQWKPRERPQKARAPLIVWSERTIFNPLRSVRASSLRQLHFVLIRKRASIRRRSPINSSVDSVQQIARARWL